MQKEKLILSNIAKYKVDDANCENLCMKARLYGIPRVLVGPASLPVALRILEGSSVRVGVSVSYPSGAYFPEAKAAEAAELANSYPQLEAFYAVMAVGRFLSGYMEETAKEVTLLKEAVGEKKLYLFTELSVLSNDQVQELCGLLAENGADGIVDTTGFAPYDIPFPETETLENLIKAARGKLKVVANGAFETAQQASMAAQLADYAIVTGLDGVN